MASLVGTSWGFLLGRRALLKPFYSDSASTYPLSHFLVSWKLCQITPRVKGVSMQNILKVSCCTQCCGRLWQLEKTFAHNLAAISALNFEWCILNYASPDGLHEYILEHGSDAIRAGILRYARVEQSRGYDIIRAKNIISLLSSFDIVFNLDADNFVSTEVLTSICDAFLDPQVQLVHNWSGVYHDGTHGRIAVRRSAFLAENGYAEDLTGASVHDDDIVRRHSERHRVVFLPYTGPGSIPNTKEQTVENLSPELRARGYTEVQLENRRTAHDRWRAVPQIQPMEVELFSREHFPESVRILVSAPEDV